ncbi:hypothetical protein KIW84_033436 [Lathyrus oleraceus]|uniref:C3H1-type domain-containing protein n=1 Tax=Pisum sativum TaxID=3888 RepID=A0A9D4Y1B4_PEA|nr:hypothetical protein KIW84_033436 [Pisum sativum]
MWQMNLRSSETMESGPYPEHPGEPDCSYYIRTGLCRFGATCRFNHPPNRKLAIATARMKGEFPERLGQPECQYYLKTGTCKFGATCRFHHPKDKAGVAGRVALNILGYPLRPNESECAYYLRTGQCKFGNTCKFHHPQPSNMVLSMRGSTVYPTVQSPTTPGQQSYAAGITNWSSSSYVPSPRWQGPSSYAPLILPQGVVSVPGWSTYGGQMGSESPQQTMRNDQTYGTSHQGELENAGLQGAYSQYRSGSVPVGFYALQRDNIFPERPDQPECQFYMKTGDCKFGAVCRFHHPRERQIPAPDCVLSPIGLPLRPVLTEFAKALKKNEPSYSRQEPTNLLDIPNTIVGLCSDRFPPKKLHEKQGLCSPSKRCSLFVQGEPLCVFYSRYGICKFGPSCKFDHPMGIFTYNVASPLADTPGRRLLGSSSGTAALSLSSEGLVESGTAKPRRLSLSETRPIPPGDDNIDDEG